MNRSDLIKSKRKMYFFHHIRLRKNPQRRAACVRAECECRFSFSLAKDEMKQC